MWTEDTSGQELSSASTAQCAWLSKALVLQGLGRAGSSLCPSGFTGVAARRYGRAESPFARVRHSLSLQTASFSFAI